MALGFTIRGSGYFFNSPTTKYSFSPTTGFTAQNSMGVVMSSFYNSGTNGASPFSSVTDSLGNTWTTRLHYLYDPSTANAGFVGVLATTNQDVGKITTGTTINVNFSASCSYGNHIVGELTAATGSYPTYITGNTAAAATITSGTLSTGQMILGMLTINAQEGVTTYDSDTTNGSWSTGFGVTTTRATHTQNKVVTGSGTQTWNVSASANPEYISYTIFTETASAKPRNYYFFLE